MNEGPTGTRERLLDAAWRCVSEGGIERATSRAITATAGANLGAITYHFGSKEALLAEAAAEAIERLITPALAALQDESVDPATRLLRALMELQEAYARSVSDAPAYFEVLLHTRRTGTGERMADRLRRVRAALSAQLTSLRATHAIPAWVEPEPMAALLVAVAEGVVLQAATDSGGPAITAVADQFARLLLASQST
jgi:AcrR family transcriptional regulator